MARRYDDDKINDLATAVENMAEYTCRKNLSEADEVVRSLLFEQSAGSFIASLKKEIKNELKQEIKEELAKELEQKRTKINF